MVPKTKSQLGIYFERLKGESTSFLDKNKSNERWPLIENGQALEKRVQQRLNEGEEDTGGPGVVRMSSGVNKEWYNLDTIGTASAGGRHSGSRTLLGLVAPADSARSNQYESGT